MKKILFYGDSNTYGYDPRGYFGMRYPSELRWTSLVREHFKDRFEIIEEGQNGRCLPVLPREEAFLIRLLEPLSAEDLLVIMLGTNDILLTDHPVADLAIRKMDRLLEWLVHREHAPICVVIGPVPIANTSMDMQVYYEESLRLNAGYDALCKEKGIAYFDAAKWDIPLAYDGVHFSEEGCRKFAGGVMGVVKHLPSFTTV